MFVLTQILKLKSYNRSGSFSKRGAPATTIQYEYIKDQPRLTMFLSELGARHFF